MQKAPPHHSDALHLAAEAGQRVLEAGGETYRAEEAVVSLCRSWGLRDADCFATPTGLMASAIGEDGRSVSVIRRIKHRAVDLHRIGRLNEEIRRVADEGQDLAAFEATLERILSERPYNAMGTMAASGACALFFTFMFGGHPLDGAVAFLAGILIRIVYRFLQKRRFPDFILNMVGGFVAAAVATAAVRFFPDLNVDKTVIGSIMMLVPGLVLVNSIRDIIAGDLVAGVARLADALIAATAIAMGAGFALQLHALLGGAPA